VLVVVSLVVLAAFVVPYPRVAIAAAAVMLGVGARAWARGLAAASRVIALFGAQAHQLCMIACPEDTQPRSASAVSRDQSVSARAGEDHSRRSPIPVEAGGEAAYEPVFQSMVALESPSPSEIEEQFA
jgi:hypothetical protein